MKKTFCALFAVCIFCATSAVAASRTLNGINENQQLGMMAGLALACNAGGKLDDYELIASRILANSAPTELAEKNAVREYAEAKFNAFKEQKETPQATCGEILESFSRLPIFKSVVYADGTVRTPDGRILKPRKGAKIPAPKRKQPVVNKSKNK